MYQPNITNIIVFLQGKFLEYINTRISLPLIRIYLKKNVLKIQYYQVHVKVNLGNSFPYFPPQ